MEAALVLHLVSVTASEPDSAELRHEHVSTRPQTNTALPPPPRPPRLKGIRSLIVSGVGGPPFV